jgi:hypothetical protein
VLKLRLIRGPVFKWTGAPFLFFKNSFPKRIYKKGKSAIVPPENMVGIVLTYNK